MSCTLKQGSTVYLEMFSAIQFRLSIIWKWAVKLGKGRRYIKAEKPGYRKVLMYLKIISAMPFIAKGEIPCHLRINASR